MCSRWTMLGKRRFFTSVYTAEYATYRKSIVEYETECAWMTGTR